MALGVWQATIVDDAGNVQTSAQIEVRRESNGALAAIYSDRDGTTPLSNPFDADEDGFARFYVAGGAFQVVATKGGFSRTWRHVSIGLLKELDSLPATLVQYDRTAAEIAASVTPINYAKWPSPWKDISRFVSDNTGATDVSAQMANAFAAEKNIIIPDGTYLIEGTSGQVALQTRPGMRIEGATREGAILLAGTSGMYVLGYDGSHSNISVANLLINGNSLAARGFSSVSPSQGSSGNLALHNFRAALCTGPAIYIKNMTYADLNDIQASSSGEGLNLDSCFDTQVRGVSVFRDCTAAALNLLECSQVRVFGARMFTNPSVTASRIAYVNSSSSCGFFDCTFESQSTTPVGAELEVDKSGTRETIDLIVDRCEFIGTAATKDRCVKLGTTATVYKPLFSNCRFFKPTSNESVLADRVAFGVFDGCRDISSYSQTDYVRPTIRQNNSSTINVINRAYSGVARETMRYATADNAHADLLQLTAEYAPAGTGTATQVGFGGAISFGGRNPNNIFRESYVRIGFSVQTSGFNGGNLEFYTRRDAGTAPVLRGAWTQEGHFRPEADNTYNLGGASNRWGTVYAGTGTINTSDASTKQDIAEADEAERRVATHLKSMFRKYRLRDAVAQKGGEARIHFGIIAQDVADAFTAEGLDPHRYALFCSDTWYEYEAEVVFEEGRTESRRITDRNPRDGATKVTRLGIRYDELLAFILGAL